MKKALTVIVLAVIIAVNVLAATVIASDFRQQEEWEDTRQVVTICVQYGDTLYGYWIEYAPNWMGYEQYIHEIQELNDMESCSIYAGQTIQVYVEE